MQPNRTIKGSLPSWSSEPKWIRILAAAAAAAVVVVVVVAVVAVVGVVVVVVLVLNFGLFRTACSKL